MFQNTFKNEGADMLHERVTYEDVSAVIQRMTHTGESPNARTVRAALGRGSPNIIHRHLNKWSEEHPMKRFAAPAALSFEITKSILTEIQRLRAETVAELEQQLASARVEADELASEGERLDARIEELEPMVANLTTARDTLSGRLEEAQAEIQRITSELEHDRHEVETAHIEAAQAQLNAKAQADRIKWLETDSQQLASELATERAQRQEAQTSLAVAQAQIEELRGQLEKTENRIGEARTEALKEARKRVANEVHRAAEELHRLESTLADHAEPRKDAKKAATQLVDALRHQVNLRAGNGVAD
jgi:chromosome segregation ATPase